MASVRNSNICNPVETDRPLFVFTDLYDLVTVIVPLVGIFPVP